MKFTLNWLRDHLEFASEVEQENILDQLCHQLTAIGLEVEGVDDPVQKYQTFFVAKVVAAEQHPNADRLRVCTVDYGAKETVQVVCGAPNARKDMVTVLALPGTYIPGRDMTLEKGSIRGVSSMGMMCSEMEMEISEEHDGIIDLDENMASIGTSYATLMDRDPVIEIGITPNRGDCLGVYGIARDLAASGFGSLIPLSVPKIEEAYQSPIKWQRSEQIGQGCLYVTGRYFKQVKNVPSPQWMQKRLTAIGLRPISALVDITNYVSFDLGRPLHVFDAQKIAGSNLTMDYAGLNEKGERNKILALNDQSYLLEPDMMIIRDDKGAQAIAGVMGGELSGCQDDTTEVFLEVALFDPIKVAEAGRKLSIDSDARYRFERKLDPQSAEWGCDIATDYILKLCGGIASERTSAGTIPDNRKDIALPVAMVKNHGGLEVSSGECESILCKLGFAVKQSPSTGNNQTIIVTRPTWRNDIDEPQCLVEEILRIKGYDAIPEKSLPRIHRITQQAINVNQRRAGFMRRQLAMEGLYETVTWSFISKEMAEAFGGGDENLSLLNPIASHLSDMRPSILPLLIEGVKHNHNRGMSRVGLFEIGPIFKDHTPKGQLLSAAGVRSGALSDKSWQEQTKANKDDQKGLYVIKSDALKALSVASAPVQNLVTSLDAPNYYHPGRSASLRLGGNVLAYFGEIHPSVLAMFDISYRVWAFEIFIDRIPQPRKNKETRTRPLFTPSSYPSVKRDFAFVLDNDVPAEKLIMLARGADKKLIKDVHLFDIYQGAELEGKKSLAFSVTLQAQDRTLEEKEIEVISQQIIDLVQTKLGGHLR